MKNITYAIACLLGLVVISLHLAVHLLFKTGMRYSSLVLSEQVTNWNSEGSTNILILVITNFKYCKRILSRSRANEQY